MVLNSFLRICSHIHSTAVFLGVMFLLNMSFKYPSPSLSLYLYVSLFKTGKIFLDLQFSLFVLSLALLFFFVTSTHQRLDILCVVFTFVSSHKFLHFFLFVLIPPFHLLVLLKYHLLCLLALLLLLIQFNFLNYFSFYFQ